MKITLHTVNIDLTPAIKSFIDEKINSLERFFKKDGSEIVEARVEVGKPSRHHKSGFIYYAEVNLKIGQKLLRASAEHLDLYAAIDQVRNKIEVQIKKFKDGYPFKGLR